MVVAKLRELEAGKAVDILDSGVADTLSAYALLPEPTNCSSVWSARRVDESRAPFSPPLGLFPSPCITLCRGVPFRVRRRKPKKATAVNGRLPCPFGRSLRCRVALNSWDHQHRKEVATYAPRRFFVKQR